jgi:hypothetical protein
MNSYQQSLYRHFMDNVILLDQYEGRDKLQEFDPNLDLKKIDKNGNYDVVRVDDTNKVIARYRSTGLEF